MAMGRIRTDLALETKEKFEEEQVEIRGVVIEEDYNEEKDIKTTVVKIETENGAKTMGRPQGIYITMEAPNLSVPDEDYHREISGELARHMKKLLPEKKELQALVVGLGNREITPDVGTGCNFQFAYYQAYYPGIWSYWDRGTLCTFC